MRILSLLPLFYRKNFVSLLIVSTVIVVISYSALVIMVRKQALTQFIEQCESEKVTIKSPNWSVYQRLEITSVTEQMPSVESAFEIMKLSWHDKIPLVLGVSTEFLEQNYKYYGLDPVLIETFRTKQDFALVSQTLFKDLSMKLHEQFNCAGLFLRSKGIFKPSNIIDRNIVFIHKSLITEALKSNKQLNPTIFIDVRLKKGANFNEFKHSINSVLLSRPEKLEILRLKNVVTSSLNVEMINANILSKSIWVVIIILAIFVWFMQKIETRKLVNDIAILYEIGMIKHDFVALSWGFVIYPMILSASTSLLLFALMSNGIWIKIQSYNLFVELAFHTFLKWFMFTIVIFWVWWTITYLIFISKTSASSIEDHAQFIRSMIYPEKILRRGQNTIRRAKSALFKLLHKETE